MNHISLIILPNATRIHINGPLWLSSLFKLFFPDRKVRDHTRKINRDKITKPTKQYQKFRNDVLNRWNCKCAKCRAEGVRLVIHHLIPYSKDKDLALDPDNAAIFCHECDKTFHSIYGGNTCTPEDFYEFIETK